MHIVRVLVIPNNFPTSSEPQNGIFVLRQILALRRLGWEIEVFRTVPHAPPINARWKAFHSIPSHYTVENVRVDVHRTLILPRFILAEYIPYYTIQSLRATLQHFRPQIVHAHGLLPAGSLATTASLPVVVTAHGSDAYDYPWRRPGLYRAARQVIERAAKVVAVSAFIRDHCERLGAEGVSVVPNGADPTIFFPADRVGARASLSISPTEKVIAFVGYLSAAKGIYDLANALAMLSDLAPTLVLVGVGSDRAMLARRLNELRIEHRFLGVLSQHKVADVFAAADVVALPSHREGLPAVICEAMLSGRAVVASTIGGIPEIISHCETGYLTKPKDPTSLSAGLRYVLEDIQFRERLERNAHEYAAANLTWEANARQYDCIYQAIATNSMESSA